MEKNKNLMKGSMVVLLVLTMLIVVFGGQPNKYASFQGTVTFNGANAEVGVPVRACFGNIDKGTVDTYNASGSTQYVTEVWNETNGDTIVFRVDGLLANEVGIYDDSEFDVSVNLTLNQSLHTFTLVEGWNLISIPVEMKYDGCLDLL